MFSFVLILLCLVTVWSRDTFDSKTHVDPVPRAVLPDIQGKTGELDITLHGKPIHMTGYKSDMVFKWVAQKGSWEPHLLKLTHRLLTNGDEVVFDLGANLGYMTLQFAVLVPNGHVFAFEPYPPNYYLLNKNIADNKFSHVSIFNRAVSDTDVDLCFQTKINKNMGDIRLKSESTAVCSSSEIRVGSMSTSDISISRLDLMKIDVQGYELRVLKTSEGSILKHRPYIIIEFEEWNMKRMKDKYSTPDLVQYIRQTLNYEVFAIAFDYPSDHILVPTEKLDEFRRKFRGHFIPLVKPNHINKNFEAGVKETLCLRGADCPEFFRNMTNGVRSTGA